MEKVSKIISKKVISLEDASLVGYISNVIFDERVKTFLGLIVIDDESENSFVLKAENIYSMSDEAVMIKDAKCLQYNISSMSNNPIGKVVYDCHGNNLGRVEDVEIKGRQVKRVLTSLCEFPQKYIKKSGDNFIIFGTYKSEKSKTFAEQIGPMEGLENISVKIAVPTAFKPESPIRIYANSKSLLGKIVTNDLFGFNNELIAQKNDVINQKILNKAKLHNKLNLLNYYSK